MKIVIGLIVLAALAAACHERRQDPPPDYGAIRARSDGANGALQKEKDAQPSNPGQ